MNKILIIAEAGVNHNGDINIAKKLIDVASDAGVDIVKFQTFNAEKIASRCADKARYQLENTGIEETQIQMLKKLELNHEMHVELIEYCDRKGIKFLSTPFDLESIRELDELGIDLWKIPSGEITNYPYLVEIAKTHKPIIMSTGMSNMEEIRAALRVLNENGAGKLSVLHCNTQYPTPYEDVNLNAMRTIKEEIGVKVGYSDHTVGIEVPIAAVAMGATIIEKHFTLDRNMEGPDHKASLEPDELREMVLSIRNIEKSLGNGVKEPSKSEYENIVIARKSIVAKAKIKKGELFGVDNITTKRPGTGISPMMWNEVIGIPAPRDFEVDDIIEI